MSACETQTVQNFTQARFDCLVQKAAASGIVISGNEGQASKDGITIRWNFDSVNQTIEVQCIDAPFLLPCGIINSNIQNLLASCP